MKHFFHHNFTPAEKRYLRSLKPTSWSTYSTLSLKEKELAFALPEIEKISFLKKLHSFCVSNNEREMYNLLLNFYPKDVAIHYVMKIRLNYECRAIQLGRWALVQETKDIMPYFKYLSPDPSAMYCKTQHPELNGLILPVDHPFWNTHTPPWYWEDCDSVVQIPEMKVTESGIDISRIHEGFITRDGIEYDIRSPIEKGEAGPVCVKIVSEPLTSPKKYPQKKIIISKELKTENEQTPQFANYAFLSIFLISVIIIWFCVASFF